MDTLLRYAYKYKQAREIALTISLSFATIKEWYYLVKEQEKFPTDEHEQDNKNADPSSSYQDEEGE